MLNTKHSFENKMYSILTAILNNQFDGDLCVSCDIDSDSTIAMKELIVQRFVEGVDINSDTSTINKFDYYDDFHVTYPGLVFIDNFTKENN